MVKHDSHGQSNGGRRIVTFGAHPDDIEIGMGGTIAKLSGSGYNVKPIIATLPSFTKNDTKEQRKREAVLSAKIMGCERPEFLDLPPEDLIFGRKLVSLIDKITQKYQPEAVFTTWAGDSHQDHYILTRAVIAASRDLNNLFMYETMIPGGITEHSFRPQLYVDISNTVDIKKNALEWFESQKVRNGPLWINAIVGRSSFRGYQMNTAYAEAFEVIKVTKW
jgi:LmbE family N-acetylglucosaminyl deacetylase